MELDHYILETGRQLFTYEFTSTGPRGNILKRVQFTILNKEYKLYNLAFGDVNNETDEIDDAVVTDNKDTDKVLATVGEAVYKLCDQIDGIWIYATGRTSARTRLYQMGLNRYFNSVKADFTIYGEKNNVWEPFVSNRNYNAFLAQKRLKFEI